MLKRFPFNQLLYLLYLQCLSRSWEAPYGEGGPESGSDCAKGLASAMLCSAVLCMCTTQPLQPSQRRAVGNKMIRHSSKYNPHGNDRKSSVIFVSKGHAIPICFIVISSRYRPLITLSINIGKWYECDDR